MRAPDPRCTVTCPCDDCRRTLRELLERGMPWPNQYGTLLSFCERDRISADGP